MHNEAMIDAQPKGLNLNTAIFMGSFHPGAAHPTSARHGLAWYEIDINWWGISVVQLLGFARTTKLVNLAQRFLA
ncbi:MAG TPA: hypothetical protein VFP47_06445 [Pyrinomonadaceae bacterium]|nr:hypothetical protein [Pyrinomonadaceae bacterium]